GIDRGPAPAEDALDSHQNYGLSVFGIAEPNCGFDDKTVSLINAALTRDHGRGYAVCGSTSNKPGYTPGGIMQMVTGSIAGRPGGRGCDPMGRFAWTKFHGKGDARLCVITAYRVVQKKGTPFDGNSNTAYKQQVESMLRQGKIDPDPRSQVLKDLSTFMAELRQEGYEVWLMMDANEANIEGNALSKFVRKNYLHDPHEQNASRPTTTRMGSTSIIDYMLCTEGILQYVRTTGYRPLHEGINSDHVMLWADADLELFFGNSSPAVNPPGKREFNCDNSIMRDRFLANLKKIHSHNRLPDRIRRLEAEIKLMGIDEARVKKYNSLDKELIASIKAAAKKTVRVNRGYDRSPTLTEARERVHMWRSILTSARHAIPITERARSIAEKQGVDLEFHERSGTSIKTLQRCVQDSWEHLKECQREAQNLRSVWMSSLARYKASEDDDEEAARILRTIARNLRDRKMHQTLTHWIKGAHAGLEFIEIPTAEWYYSESMDELYHYDKGVFEAHAPDCETQCHFFRHHVLKVIPDDAREVEVCYEPEGIRRVGTLGRNISWKRLTEKSEMEAHLLRRNKRHLQQVAMESTPPSQGYFESILSEFGTSNAADDLLEGETTNDMTQFPPVVRTWLGQFRRNDDDRKCYPITGLIHTDEFQAAFRS
ncbi:hypothetical protein ACHAWF_009794, partial [Thalassiosira exigua]